MRSSPDDMESIRVRLEDVLETADDTLAEGVDEVDDLESSFRNLIDNWDSQYLRAKSSHSAVREKMLVMLGRQHRQISELLSSIDAEVDKIQGRLEETTTRDEVKEYHAKLMYLSTRLEQLQPLKDYVVKTLTRFSMDVSVCEEEDYASQEKQLSDKYGEIKLSLKDTSSSVESLLLELLREDMQELKELLNGIQKEVVQVDEDLKNSHDISECATYAKRLKELRLSCTQVRTLHTEASSVIELIKRQDTKHVVTKSKEINETLDNAEKTVSATKERVYAVLLHVIKQSLKALHESLEALDARSKLLDEMQVQEIKHASDKLQQFKVIQSEQSELQTDTCEKTEKIKSVMMMDILEDEDVSKIEARNGQLIDALVDTANNVVMQEERINTQVCDLLWDKLNSLQDWLPVIKKRSVEHSEIGPHINTIKKQMQEVKIIEQQAQEKGIQTVIDGDDQNIQTLLQSSDLLTAMKEANEEWMEIKRWILDRSNKLVNAHETWDLFCQSEMDLFEYLKQKEKSVQLWTNIDLESQHAVRSKLDELKIIMSGMESRKQQIVRFKEVSDNLIQVVGAGSSVSNSIRSQLSDIQELWNNVVRLTLEARTKLRSSSSKYEEFFSGSNDIRNWLCKARHLMEQLQENSVLHTKNKKELFEIKAKLNKYQLEHIEMEVQFSHISRLGVELLNDVNHSSHITIEADLLKMSKEWKQITKDLLDVCKPWYSPLHGSNVYTGVRNMWTKMFNSRQYTSSDTLLKSDTNFIKTTDTIISSPDRLDSKCS